MTCDRGSTLGLVVVDGSCDGIEKGSVVPSALRLSLRVDRRRPWRQTQGATVQRRKTNPHSNHLVQGLRYQLSSMGLACLDMTRSSCLFEARRNSDILARQREPRAIYRRDPAASRAHDVARMIPDASIQGRRGSDAGETSFSSPFLLVKACVRGFRVRKEQETKSQARVRAKSGRRARVFLRVPPHSSSLLAGAPR